MYLRLEAGSDEKLRVWPDGTEMVIVGGDQIVEGVTWKNVRDPVGNVGWVAKQYFAALAATPRATLTVGQPLRTAVPTFALR